jgi:arylsulfatase A-like enzyme
MLLCASMVAIANWPGRIKPGQITELTHVVDMYPTPVGVPEVSPAGQIRVADRVSFTLPVTVVGH